jgi:hypothetical protein
MNNKDLYKQIFYLFNQDGSLYLIKKLNFNLRQTFIFNLTIQVTNMLWQYEFYSLNLCLKYKRPSLNRGAEKQKYVIDIDLSNVNINFETKTINFKQAENTELEENVYKIESYFNTFIQISKNFSSTNRYPLCQELEFDNKSASMDVRINLSLNKLKKSLFIFNLACYFICEIYLIYEII